MKVTDSKSSLAIALAGVMAAVYYAFLWLPGIPVVGVPQVKIDLGASLAPVLGVILGPYLGFFTTLISDSIKVVTPPNIYGLPFILCPSVSAFSASFIVRGRLVKPAILLLAILVTGMFTPVFYPITTYYSVYLMAYFDKIIALVLMPVAVLLANKSKKHFKSKKYFHIALFLAIFIGNEVDSALGCTIFALPQVYQGIFGIPSVDVVRGLFTVSPFIYPVIRVIQSLIGYVIALPLIKVLSKITSLSEFLYVKYLKGEI